MLLGSDEAFLGKTVVDQENCCLSFAVAVSHYSMLGPLAPCCGFTRASGERGGGLLADRLGFAAKLSPGPKQ
jgi:hypothetical protein